MKRMRIWNQTNKAIAMILALSLTLLPAADVQAAPAGTAIKEAEEAEETRTLQAEDTQEETGGGQETGEDTSDAYASDEILVVYDDADTTEKKSETIQDQAEKELASSEIEVSETVAEADEGQGTVVVAEIPETMSVEEAIETAQESANVSYAQPNFIYQLMEEVSDTSINDSYYQDPTSNDYPYYLDKTHVTDAWESAKCNQNVSVAVIDTGCRMDHEDLAANIDADHACDASEDPIVALTASSAEAGDPDGHGTHVCGLIAAEANNGKGIAGTSYNANIIPVKIFDDDQHAGTDDCLRALDYCKDLAADPAVNLKVINMSLGYYPVTSQEGSEDLSLKQAIASLRSLGVLSVCAGGNGENGTPRTDVMYPSDFEECLSVTSLTKDLKDSTWSDYNPYKDISAPGEGMISTWNGHSASYIRMSGSSMAAPVVSGICALLFASMPTLTVDEAVEALKATADEITDQDADREANTGSAGLVNAQEALQYFQVDAGKTSISGATVAFKDNKNEYDYCGTAIRPEITVSLNGDALTENTDYTVYYSNNTNAGTATVKVRGTGSYTGSAEISFTIRPVSINACTVEDGIKKYYLYSGMAVEPDVILTYRGVSLKKSADYTVAYQNNTSKGTAAATVSGTGNFTGSFVCYYEIIGLKVLFPDGSTYGYTGQAVTPKVTLYQTENGVPSALVENRDYTLSYVNNIEVGTAFISFTGMGDYSFSARVSFTIASVGGPSGVSGTDTVVPKGTKLLSLSKKSKGFKAKWKKQTSNTSGYQIQYARNRDFSGAKTVTIKKNTTTSKTVSKLKKKTRYYVRIRTYVKRKGVKYYSAWSAVKKVKTK